MSRTIPVVRWLAGLLLLLLAFLAGRGTKPESIATAESHAVIPVERKREPLATAAPPPSLSAPASSEDQIVAGVRRIGDHPASPRSFDELVDGLISWAKINPDAALAYAKEHFKSSERLGEMITRILSGLAKSNPQAAWDWSLKNSPENQQDINAILTEFGKNDPASAWNAAQDYAQKYPKGAHNAYAGVLEGMTYAGNFAAAANFIAGAQLTGPTDDYNFPSLLVTEWARYDPPNAAAWVQALPDSLTRDQALNQLGQSWASVNQADAANFAVMLPPSKGQQGMMSAVIGTWIMTDPAGVAQWANQFQGNPGMDRTMAQIATLPGIPDYGTAIAWANTITDPELQTESLATIFNRWWANAPDVAQASLAQLSVPPDMRDDVLRRVQQSQIPRQ